MTTVAQTKAEDKKLAIIGLQPEDAANIVEVLDEQCHQIECTHPNCNLWLLHQTVNKVVGNEARLLARIPPPLMKCVECKQFVPYSRCLSSYNNNTHSLPLACTCLTCGPPLKEENNNMVLFFCKHCVQGPDHDLVKDAMLLVSIHMQISMRHRMRIMAAATKALKELVSLGLGAQRELPCGEDTLLPWLHSGEISIAEYPNATFVTSVSLGLLNIANFCKFCKSFCIDDMHERLVMEEIVTLFKNSSLQQLLKRH